MKKIMKLLVFICLAITMLVPTQIFASTGVLKSLDIVGFNNGNIETEKYYSFDFETNEEIIGTPDFHLYYVDENDQPIDWGRSFGGRDFVVEEEFKWKYENYKFVLLEMYYDTENGSYVEYYSPYTASDINNYGLYFEEPLYSIEDKYSFKLTDYDKDETGPTVDLVSFSQNGRKINYEYTGSDSQSFISRVVFTFRGKEHFGYFVYEHYEEYNKKQSGQIDLLDYFPDNEYDTYELESVIAIDKVGNETEISTDKSIVLSEDINPLEKIPSMTTTVETNQMDNKVYFRVDSGNGDDTVITKFYDGDECIYDYHDWIDPNDFDLSKEGTYNVKLNHTVHITPGKSHSYEYDVDVCIVDVIGKVLFSNVDLEICVTYDEYKAHYLDTTSLRTTTVQLDSGEIITIQMKPGGYGSAPGFADDLPYYMEGCSYYYNPMYIMDDESWNCSVSLDTRYYIQDKDGNLLDNNGNLRVKYEDRKDVKHKTLNDAVNITSLEGSIPTYSVVNAEETNVDNVFDSEAVAYDITLVADGENVQPVDDVTVSVALPSELSGKEVEVYYVDDNNNKTLLDSTCTNNTVSFDTGHFSTYAVVEKKMPTSYTLYVDLNGGVSEKEISSEREMAIGAYIDLPRSGVSRKGYTFDGWQYVDASGNVIGDGTVPSRMPTSDVYVIAKWNPQTYRIALNQSDLPGISFTVESEDFTLPIPEREGYTFVGWQWTDGDGSVAREIVIPKGTMFSRYYTAIWEKIREYDVYRIFGNDRYETAYKVADEYKALLKVDKFSAIIVANGANFADALAGSYLSSEKSAPILMTDKKETNINKLVEYAKANLQENGTVYILGGTAAVSDKVDKALSAYQIKRLAGKNRYETNMLILKAAGYEYFTDELVIATGTNFADSLSVSATGKPIMLVGNSLSAEQRSLISRQKVSSNTDSIYIVGGTSAVSKKVENAIKEALPKRTLNFGNGDSYDISAKVERIAGDNRYETSVLVAKKFFPTSEKAVLAYAKNYPDGLSGGALAKVNNAPLLLVDGKNYEAATKYGKEAVTTAGYVLGGNTLVTDEATKAIFAMQEGSTIVNK